MPYGDYNYSTPFARDPLIGPVSDGRATLKLAPGARPEEKTAAELAREAVAAINGLTNPTNTRAELLAEAEARAGLRLVDLSDLMTKDFLVIDEALHLDPRTQRFRHAPQHYTSDASTKVQISPPFIYGSGTTLRAGDRVGINANGDIVREANTNNDIYSSSSTTLRLVGPPPSFDYAQFEARTMQALGLSPDMLYGAFAQSLINYRRLDASMSAEVSKLESRIYAASQSFDRVEGPRPRRLGSTCAVCGVLFVRGDVEAPAAGGGTAHARCAK